MGIAISSALATQLEAYYRLLAHWNTTINLTALPLNPMTDRAMDRLLIEPVAAARHLPTTSPVWFDLGSGGGSPAIPLKLARPAGRLTMVESRERKAAFLTEAIRVLEIDDAEVEAQRIEAVAADPRWAGTANLITVRAVRLGPTLLAAIWTLAGVRGQVLLFGTKRSDLQESRGFEVAETPSNSAQLGGSAFLLLNRVGL